MKVFQKKQLTPAKRVCFRLKEARKKARIKLSDLAKQTKISKKHLEALEECRFADIPYAVIYQKNFIKRYAQILDLPVEDLLNQFIVEEVGSAKKKKEDVCKKIKSNRFQNLPSLLRASIMTIVIISLIGYLSWQVRSIIKPPELTLFSPQNGYITTDYELLIHGKTHQETQVSVNGKDITNGDDGQFKEILTLSPGINTITVSAKKKHGKSTTIVRHVTLKTNVEFSYRK